MQQTRISDIIRELVSEGTFSVRKLEVFSKPHKLLSSINEKGTIRFSFWILILMASERRVRSCLSEIRQQDANAVIIFVTTHSEFAPISFKYKVSALDFIDKTVSKCRVQTTTKTNIDFCENIQYKCTIKTHKIF